MVKSRQSQYTGTVVDPEFNRKLRQLRQYAKLYCTHIPSVRVRCKLDIMGCIKINLYYIFYKPKHKHLFLPLYFDSAEQMSLLNIMVHVRKDNLFVKNIDIILFCILSIFSYIIL